MKLVCGLGNPGTEYQGTRHNVGYVVCDILSLRHRIPLSGRKFQGRIGNGRIGSESVVMLKPYTYMNLSGRSVASAARFYKIEPMDLLVIHDDVDIEPGRIVVKFGGGTAGHKGLESVIRERGDQDFIRVRFGVGHPENPFMDVSDYVLSRFEATELERIRERLEVAADAVEAVLMEGYESAANRYNRKDQ